MTFGFARELLPDERLELGSHDGEAKPFVFPGLAITSFEGEMEADEPKASGQDDAELKIKGRKLRAVSTKLTWQSEMNTEAKAYLKALLTGPHAGKPREISHPDAEVYKVQSVVFLKIGKIERQPGQATVEISGKSAGKPKGTTAGGAKGDGSSGTAKDAGKWVFTDPVHGKPQALGNTGNKVGGFDDPATAPKAEPPK